MEKINLETFAGGALQEKFDDAMQKVLQNMIDPNTPWKNKRKITVDITFEQNEDRDDCIVDVSVVPKLAAVKPVSTKMAIAKDYKTGKCYAQEYGNNIKGQMSFDDLQIQDGIVVDGRPVDPKTGEIKSVVDFRTVKQG